MLGLVLVCAPIAPLTAQQDNAEVSPPEARDEAATTEAADREPRRVERLGDNIGGENDWQVQLPRGLDRARQTPETVVPDVAFPDADLNTKLREALSAPAEGARDDAARERLTAVLATAFERASELVDKGDLADAGRYLEAIRTLNSDYPGLDGLERRLNAARRLAERLQRGRNALEQGRLIAPPENNARSAFRAALELDPGNTQATEGLASVRGALVERGLDLAEQARFDRARRLLDTAAELPGTAAIEDARRRLAELREQRAAELRASVQQHIEAGAYDAAASTLDELVALGGSGDLVTRLRARLQHARAHGGLEAGQVFRDTYAGGSARGPEMVVVPAGGFMMGAPPRQIPRGRNDTPYHRVTFERGFAIARAEITVGEFGRFVEATGYRTQAEVDNGSQVYDPRRNRMHRMEDANWRHDYTGERADENLPVVHVSWHDAAAYAEWLARVTGQSYRLPSEAEFEYALRAGTRTAYWWGDGSPPRDRMTNVTGEGDVSPTGQRWSDAFDDYRDGYWGPAPVASLAVNAFGLFDMGGNVKEWVVDCWHDSYRRAPTDGSAWVNPGCQRRVVRGGDWASAPDETFSSVRVSGATRTRMSRLGFRVAKDLF